MLQNLRRGKVTSSWVTKKDSTENAGKWPDPTGEQVLAKWGGP